MLPTLFFQLPGAWLVRFVLVISQSVRADVILRDILAANFVAERHGDPSLVIRRIRVVAVIKESRRAELLLNLIFETWPAARHNSIFRTIW